MRRVKIYDTTLRDGAQGEGITFSVDDKLKIVKRLDILGIDYIEGGWPGSNPKDLSFFEKVKELELNNAKVTAFGSTRRVGIKASEDTSLRMIVESGVKAAAIFGKSWDFHVTHALKTTLEENLAMITDSVTFLKDNGLEVIYDAEHFFDAYKANRDYAIQTILAAQNAGADVIVLCDTNGGSLPFEVKSIVDDVKQVINVDLGVHMHNDGAMAVANTIMGVESGASHVQGTMNGYGERAGNADLCAVIPNLKLKMGIDCITDEQLRDLTAVSRYVGEIANMRPNRNQPFVGSSVFAHKAGIHVNALIKHPKTYEHIDPQAVGNRRRVLVSELSGQSNIMYKAKEYDIDLEKGSSGIQTILNAVKNLEYEGYHFEGAEASFELMLKRTLGLHVPLFELESFRLIIEKREKNGDPVAEASIKIKVGNKTYHTVAEGDGPVNALDIALRKALIEVYPQLEKISLSDFKVRVLDETAGTAAKVRVLIESTDERGTWGTVGVSTNIIEASWRALYDSLEYGLLQQVKNSEEA